MQSTRNWTTPTADQIDKALARLTSVDKSVYFYSKLENPLWFEPLRVRKVFDNCPDDEPWAQSLYLIKVAPTFPNAVGSVIRNLKTRNPRVLNNLLDAIKVMPPVEACSMLDVVAAWLEDVALAKNPYSFKEFADFVVASCDVRQVQMLLRTALRVDVLDKSERRKFGRDRTAVPHLDPWAYDSVLDGPFTQFAVHHIWSGLELAIDILRQALDIESPNRNADEMSGIWLKDLSDPGPMHDLKAKLSVAVFRCALIAGETDIDKTAEILLEQHYHVFHRILSRVATTLKANRLIVDLITERGFDDTVLGQSAERMELLRAAFPNLSVPQKQGILTALAADEPRDRLVEFYRWAHGTDPSSEVLDNMTRHHRYTQLKLLDGLLDKPTQALLDALKDEFSASEEDEHDGVWVGPQSPRAQAELSAMSVPEILNLLRTWKPRGTFLSPSPEGLGRELEAVVNGRPADFLARVGDLKQNIHPTYIRHIVQGLTLALRRGEKLQWPELLTLLTYATHHDRAETGPALAGETGFDVDVSWENARLVVGHFLFDALGSKEISCAQLPDVWAIIEPLIDDPDPGPEKFDADYYKRNPTQASINCVRGQALHTITRYIRRKVSCTEFRTGTTEFWTLAPEVEKALTARLDPGVEIVPAVWCTFGTYFGLYFAVAPKWTTAKSAMIFRTQRNPKLGEAAWHAYLSANAFSAELFTLLLPEYTSAVSALSAPLSGGLEYEEKTTPLGRHLIAAYMRGLVSLSSESLLAIYFELAAESDRAEVIRSLCHYLTNESKNVADDVFTRTVEFWDWRVRMIPTATQSQSLELAAFGWWQISSESRSTVQMSRLIDSAKRTGGRLEGLFALLPSVAISASHDPMLAAELVCAVAPGINPFELFTVKGSISTILETALRGGQNAAAQARRANDIFIRAGIHDFKELF